MVPGALRINEAVSSNDGVWVDEAGETEDLVELVNVGPTRLWLDDYRLGDRSDETVRLPAIALDPGATVVLFADDERDSDPAPRTRHLPFKLSSAGETLFLRDRAGTLRDRFEVPPLASNQSAARFPDGEGSPLECRYASPGQSNGTQCGPRPREQIVDAPYEPFAWPTPYPAATTPLSLNELALRPAAFVEVLNTSAGAVSLDDYDLRVAPHAPGVPWPASTDGISLRWENTTVGSGQLAIAEVTDADIAGFSDQFEGVVTLFSKATGEVIARQDFVHWPANTVLARAAPHNASFVYCAGATPGTHNDACTPITERAPIDRLRHLRGPQDFAALAAGGTELGVSSVKVVIDMQSGDVVHFLGSAAWDLHYTFVREQIEHEPHLNRCDTEQNNLFYLGWAAFSQAQYANAETRRYLLATLNHYPGTGNHTLEFETGDVITPAQMQRAFFAVMKNVWDPTLWSIRPLSDAQETKVRSMEGQVPLVGPNAPLSGMSLQPLAPGVGFGVLQYIPSADLARTPLGLDVIVITDDVPNEIDLVGGLITEAFQAPLAHVNVISRGRGTPNMALRDAKNDPAIAPHLNTLVRFEVKEAGFELRRAEPAEAEAFWASRRVTGPRLVPRSDPSVRGIQHLSARGLADIPSIGAKAAQLAELGRVVSTRSACLGPVHVPQNAFAIPIAHYLEHFAASGAETLVAELLSDPTFRTDTQVRKAGLERVQALIRRHRVEPTVLAEITTAVRDRFGTERVRFRSSSNIEDLPNFNGAGIYTSTSVEIDDSARSVEDGLRTVWAGLWNPRAYEERELSNVEHLASAMGVLVHGAYLGESANGVGISRNILDPTRGDIYYFNLQRGEASVTNPAPNVTSEEVLYRWGRNPRLVYQSRSSLTPYLVASESQMDQVACTLAAIHSAFEPLIDPLHTNRWFAMDIEFKFTREGELIVKQARPYSFGQQVIPADCREF